LTFARTKAYRLLYEKKASLGNQLIKHPEKLLEKRATFLTACI